jgi:hypothetical protein
MKTSTLVALGLAVAAMGVAASSVLLSHGVAVAAPLFPHAGEVPSTAAAPPPPQYTTAVDRARHIVRAVMAEQNLPGVSVAVGVGQPTPAPTNDGTVVWAEGFGWRDVGTRTPVTPATRFHIGTAAPAVISGAGPLGLADTGADAAKVWSPEAIGEEGEDFPPLAFLRHILFQPLGLMPSDYPLPGDRATFYVPRSDDDPKTGRRLMYMRDLACCADGKAFASTPSDLVRFALHTDVGSLDGELAGGTVMSLLTDRDGGIAVVVTSNIAHADTSALARRVRDVFAQQMR